MPKLLTRKSDTSNSFLISQTLMLFKVTREAKYVAMLKSLTHVCGASMQKLSSLTTSLSDTDLCKRANLRNHSAASSQVSHTLIYENVQTYANAQQPHDKFSQADS